jgi:iron complex transport system substrate-binding protein
MRAAPLPISTFAKPGLHAYMKVVDTNPQSLEEVLSDVLRIGEDVGLREGAMAAAARLQVRIDNAIAAAARLATPGRVPTVCLLEWLEPLFIGGHWSPELIEMAGGSHPLNPTK